MIIWDREEALKDFQLALQRLRSATLSLSCCDDSGVPLGNVLKLVDDARQALQVIAMCAEFVGVK